MTLSMTAYRFAFCMFVVSLMALLAMLAPWGRYYLGAEISRYDVGSPQVRVEA